MKYVSSINTVAISPITDEMIKTSIVFPFLPTTHLLQMVGKLNGPVPDLKTSGFSLLVLPTCHTASQPFLLMAFHIHIYYHYSVYACSVMSDSLQPHRL